MRTTTRLLAATTGLALVLCAPAGATTVSYDGSRIHINGESGEQNGLDIRRDTDDSGQPILRIADNGRRADNSSIFITIDPATAAAQNCVRDTTFSDNVVYCVDGPTTVNAGDGNDQVRGGPTADTVSGGPGDDELDGGSANDALDGGPGDDSLEGRGFSNSSTPPSAFEGADDVRGGDGNDLLSYHALTSGLSISVDDQANDPGGDNVHSDIERIEGGAADDRITGNDGPNRLEGGNGSDVISGGGGNDVVLGGLGIDQVMGDAGNDEVNGEAHGDVVEGGSGVDNLIGDTRCESAGCGGPDRIKARDGAADNVVCRDDADTVEADESDAVAGDCENVVRASGGGGGPGDTVAPVATARLLGRPRLATALKRGVPVSFTCNEACGVDGRASVSGRDARGLKSAKTVVVARGKSALGAPGNGKVTLRFTRKARKRLRSRRTVKLRVLLVVADATGNASNLTTSVTLKR